MFGEERLAGALARVAERPLDEGLEALFAEIEAFRAKQVDDVTLLLVRKAPLAAAGRGAGPGEGGARGEGDAPLRGGATATPAA
jgi:hypothetical protein